MSKKISDTQAQYWLLLHLSGKSFRQIAKLVGKDREAIAKHVKHAAEMAGSVHERLLRELMPGVLDLYKAYFEQQRKRLDQGKRVDMAPADRLLTTLGVFRPTDCAE